MESGGETGRGVVLLRYYAGEGLRIGGDVIPSVNPNALFFTERVPLGVVGLITPWNFPVAIPLWKAAPGAGLRQHGHPKTVRTRAAHGASAWRKFLRRRGFPAGVFNLVQGRGAAGAALSSAAGVDGLSFTGSAATGKKVAFACVERGAKYQLEMGGKNPVIVLADCDMEQAVDPDRAGRDALGGRKVYGDLPRHCGGGNRRRIHRPRRGEGQIPENRPGEPIRTPTSARSSRRTRRKKSSATSRRRRRKARNSCAAAESPPAKSSPMGITSSRPSLAASRRK